MNSKIKYIAELDVLIFTTLEPQMMIELFYAPRTHSNLMGLQAKSEAKKIINNYHLSVDEKEHLLERLSDHIKLTKEAEELSEELAIIGLCKTIEIRIKNAASATGLLSARKIDKLYITNDLISSFSSIGIDVESIQNYKHFIELKCLNNCLKHSGIVDKKLAESNPTQWVEGSNIQLVESHFIRLLEPNIIFLRNLGAELKSKL